MEPETRDSESLCNKYTCVLIGRVEGGLRGRRGRDYTRV